MNREPISVDGAIKRLNDITRLTTDLIWELDEDQNVIQISENSFDHLGYHWTEVQGQKLTDFCELDELGEHSVWPDWKRPFRDIIVGIRHYDGNQRHFQLSGLPVFDDEGHFKCTRGIAKDVTRLIAQDKELLAHRKHLEELVEERTAELHEAYVKSTETTLSLEESRYSLQQTRDQLDAAVQSFSEGFVLFDADDRFVTANEYFFKVHPELKSFYKPGVHVSELVGKIIKMGGVLNNFNAEGDPVARRLEMFHNCETVEYRHKDGRWFQIDHYRTRTGGTALVRTDISELKNSQLGLQLRGSIIDNLNDGIQILRLDTETIVFQSPGFETMFGYDTGELIGKHVSVLNAGTTAEKSATAREITHAMRTSGKWSGEVLNRRKDGSEFWCAVNMSSFDHPEYGLTAISVNSDISERKSLEEQLQRALRLEALGQLTSGVAHDFNNLLSIIVGNADLLSVRDPEKEKADRYLTAIKRAVERGAALTGRLLAFARKKTLVAVAADIDQLVADLDMILQRTLADNISLNVNRQHDVWDANVDPNQFEDALLNLTINARDAMPDGGKLTIETANVSLDEAFVDRHEDLEPGYYVMVAVKDNGTGMSTDILDKVLEPFFTTKEFGKGSGLGLSMVYGFARQSGGHMDIESEVGKGTTIRLYLPRAVAEEAEEGPSADLDKQSLPLRILFVEDDKLVRELSLFTLQELGYEVVEAVDAEDAIEKLRSDSSFDLLFTDIRLPGSMDGVEVARLAQELRPDIRVLYASGFGEEVLEKHGEDIPPGLLITKPYSTADLLGMINSVFSDEQVQTNQKS